MTHICTVCFRPVEEHGEECGCCDKRFFPPLCCPGCDCGSFEDAHAEITLVGALIDHRQLAVDYKSARD